MGRKNSKKQKNREKGSTGGGKLLRGVLDITRSGTGFVTVEGLETDILIRPGDFNTALHGDTVKVAVKDTEGRGRRMQGVDRKSVV